VRGSLSGAYVRKSGDTMTGALTIATTAAQPLIINRSDASDGRHLVFQRGGITQAEIAILNAEPKLRIRDSGANERLTLRADTGLLGTGKIPLSLIFPMVQPAAGENAGVVAILAAETAICTGNGLPAGTAVGDIILIAARYKYTKGATGGATRLWIKDVAGAGSYDWLESALTLEAQKTDVANEVVSGTIFSIGRVLVADSAAQWSLRGTSAGSNSSVAATDAQIMYRVFRA